MEQNGGVLKSLEVDCLLEEVKQHGIRLGLWLGNVTASSCDKLLMPVINQCRSLGILFSTIFDRFDLSGTDLQPRVPFALNSLSTQNVHYYRRSLPPSTEATKQIPEYLVLY